MFRESNKEEKVNKQLGYLEEENDLLQDDKIDGQEMEVESTTDIPEEKEKG